MRSHLACSLAVLALLSACGGSPANRVDATTSSDATERLDASREADGTGAASPDDRPDVGDRVDAPVGLDAGGMHVTPPDALDVSAPPPDAAPAVDAATVVDSATVVDAATDAVTLPSDRVDVPAFETRMRLRYPGSHTRVTRHRPTLAWANGRGDGVQVTLCRDRECTRTVMTFFAAGASAVVPSPLAAGTYFWFVEGRAQGAPTGERSATWHFRVGPRDTAVDTEQYNGIDFNNDGYSDVLVEVSSPGRLRNMVFPGGAAGPSADRAWVIDRGVSAVADLDGDGCGDLVLGHEVWFGGVEGTFARRVRQVELDQRDVINVGDVDLDGYQDLITTVVTNPANLMVGYLRRGGPEGVLATGTMLPALPDEYSQTFWFTDLYDLDGDRRPELGANSNRFGGTALAWTVCSPNWRQCHPQAYGERLAFIHSARDFDGDGRGDVITSLLHEIDVGDQMFFYLHPGAGGATSLMVPPSTTHVGSLGDINGDGCDELAISTARGTSTTLRWAPCGGAPRMDQLLPSATETVRFNGVYDVNGDGRDDVLVASETRASLRLGTADGLSETEIPLLR